MARKTAPDWTEAEDEWLRKYYPVMQNWELAEFKAMDGWPRSANSIGQRARKLGLSKDPDAGYQRQFPRRFWTEERVAWFREFVPGHTEGEISAEHERIYGFPLTEGQIGNRKTKLGVKSGTHGGRFVKGQEPPNKGKPWSEWMPEESREGCRRTQFRKGQVSGIAKERDHGLLGERLTKDGYTEIRIDPRGAKHTMERWIPLGAFNWMAANGREWPGGCKCVHIDGDVANDSADNIEPVPSDLWPLLCGAVPGQLEWHDRETLRTAILYARVTRARVDSERRARIAAGKPRKGDLEAENRQKETDQ